MWTFQVKICTAAQACFLVHGGIHTKQHWQQCRLKQTPSARRVIEQRTSTNKAIYIAMKEFPGNDLASLAKRDYHLPPFCCLH